MNPPWDTRITRVSADELTRLAGHLADLLVDAVAGGASVGFLGPLDRTAALAWWRSQAEAVRAGEWEVRICHEDEGAAAAAGEGGHGRAGGDGRAEGRGGRARVLGTVTLAFADKPNARHRAEIRKLLVHRDARGRGLGRALLAAAEKAAATAGVSLLMLDTEAGSPAETLYRSAGWTALGTVPGHAADPGGTLRPTTFLYMELGRVPEGPSDRSSSPRSLSGRPPSGPGVPRAEHAPAPATGLSSAASTDSGSC